MIRYPQNNAPTIDPHGFMSAASGWQHAGSSLPTPALGDRVAPPFWRTPPTDLPPTPGAFTQPGGIAGLLGQLQGLIAQIIASLQRPFAAASTTNEPGSPEMQFQKATLGSTGDPHLAIDGTVNGSNGTTNIDHHFDSMISHADLLHSNDFAGGYQVSTTVGSPNANGVTTNDSATIALNNGNDTIGMNEDGTFTISSDGQAYTLASGQSMQLDGGETVTRNQDGSLTVSEQSLSGGSLATTLKSWGGGVDVNATGANVAIGGDIVNGRS